MYEPFPAPLADYATADNELLAERDGMQFYRVELVIKRRDGQYAGVYCDYRQWSQTAAGQLAIKDTVIRFQQEQINALAERLASLEQRAEQADWHTEHAQRLAAENLGLRTSTGELQKEVERLTNGLNRLKATMIPAAPQPVATTPITRDHTSTVTCRYGCGEVFANNAGRGSHERKVHGSVWVAEQPDAPYRCPLCSSDAFTQSLSYPDRCIRCAKPNMNGHALEQAA